MAHNRYSIGGVIFSHCYDQIPDRKQLMVRELLREYLKAFTIQACRPEFNPHSGERELVPES